jgi:hypothetical protein
MPGFMFLEKGMKVLLNMAGICIVNCEYIHKCYCHLFNWWPEQLISVIAVLLFLYNSKPSLKRMGVSGQSFLF